jgi:glyoxylase-like metal-dependent hydrolase (beta-lactamase superfamily II)
VSDQVADWTEPGAFEVAPGVHRIPLPMPNDGLRAVNVYAIAAGEGCVLIDSGWALAEARGVLESALAQLGYDLGSVRRFLVTHAHRDHYTLGIEVQRLLGTKVGVGIGERNNIERAIANTDRALATLLPAWGAPHLATTWAKAYTDADRDRSAAQFGLPDEWLSDGQQLEAGERTLTAISTPGHTQGHLVFLDAAAAVMFTGDHVLPHITPSIGFEPARVGNPLSDYLSSLRLMLSNPDARMLPAHGPIGDSVHVRVRELLHHHEVRLSTTLDAVVAGAASPYEAARRIGWTRRNTAFDAMDVFNQILATGETMAHLMVLADRGQVTKHVDGAGALTFGLPSGPPARPASG